MDRSSRIELIITLLLSILVIVVFARYNEGFMLFLLEIFFIAIIGAIYTGLVFIALILTEFIEKLLWRVKNGKESRD